MRKLSLIELNISAISWLFVLLELTLMAYQLFHYFTAVRKQRKALPIFALLILIVWNCTHGTTFGLFRLVLINTSALFLTVCLMFVSFFYKETAIEQPDSPDVPLANRVVEDNSQTLDPFLRNCETFLLTGREKQVALLIRKGYKNRHIADELFIAEKTVESHIQNIFQKVGERNKMALIHKLSQ